MNRMLWLLLLLAWLVPAPAVDLYTVTVPVADDSPQARQEAMRAALRQVLERAAGRPLPKAKAGKVLDRAEDLVQQFRYLEAPASSDAESGRQLQVSFDAEGVNRALQVLGLAPWEGGRPTLLLWMALDEEGRGRRRLADPERDADLWRRAKKAAAARGFELLAPLMDLEDRRALTAADLWLGQAERIRAASARYGDLVPLVARLTRLGKGWRGRWLMLTAEGAREFERSGKTLEAALENGLARATGLLAARYRPAADGEAGVVRLRLMGLRTVDDYARARQLLESLALVRSATPLSARGDEIVWRLEVRGGTEALARRLGQEPALAPAPAMPEAADGEAPPALSYTLR